MYHITKQFDELHDSKLSYSIFKNIIFIYIISKYIVFFLLLSKNRIFCFLISYTNRISVQRAMFCFHNDVSFFSFSMTVNFLSTQTTSTVSRDSGKESNEVRFIGYKIFFKNRSSFPKRSSVKIQRNQLQLSLLCKKLFEMKKTDCIIIKAVVNVLVINLFATLYIQNNIERMSLILFMIFTK